jgi:hypothetical protein
MSTSASSLSIDANHDYAHTVPAVEISQSTLKERARKAMGTAWNTATYLLTAIEPFVPPPYSTPIAVVNFLINTGSVRTSF